jgi:uncharacterized membrane protein
MSSSARTAIIVALGVVGVVAYPVASSALVGWLGVRVAATVGLAALALPILWRRALGGKARETPVAGTLLPLAACLAAAVVSDALVFIRLIPAVVYTALAIVFLRSLGESGSIIESAARAWVPEAPEFIRDYCRGVTVLWTGFFAASAFAIAGLAVSGSPFWQAFSGGWLYAAMAAITAVEFFVRKTWFRYYWHGGPFDRFWSGLFPAENTEMGRRSMAYIERMKASQN